MVGRRPHLIAAFLVGLAALLTAASARCQEQEPPRRLLFLFETAEGARLSPSEQLLLYESLLVRLGRASERIAVLEYEQSGVPGTDELRDTATASRRADSWVFVTVGGSWPQLTVSARGQDLVQAQTLFELSFEATIRRGAVDLERHFWDPVTDALTATLSGSGKQVAKTVSREPLTIRGAPGTRILGLEPGPVELGESGALEIETLLPATFSLRATRLGYDPVEQDFYVEPGAGVLDLGQEPGTRWAFSFYLQMMNYPGFDASFYPVRDFYWVKLGFNTFLIGLILAEDREESMLVSYSLSHLNLSTGVYLNASDRLFRFYAGLGAFLRVITAKEWAIAIEPIAPWGLYPILGTEISRRQNLRFFVEYTPLLYFPPDAELFWLSIPEDSGPPILPIPVKSRVVFWELAVFRFGVRWLL
ncbi:MAG: hypothetical protein JW820_09650 [Spirochaetales bacterium]|nr:hypothetical protein [Spirochaetales bacterium]